MIEPVSIAHKENGKVRIVKEIPLLNRIFYGDSENPQKNKVREKKNLLPRPFYKSAGGKKRDKPAPSLCSALRDSLNRWSRNPHHFFILIIWSAAKWGNYCFSVKSSIGIQPIFFDQLDRRLLGNGAEPFYDDLIKRKK
jgi:hypothetical protein